jgi:hypothetical protein
LTERLALKRLTRSDLTLFESQFRRLNVGKQKAINLNANVFARDLYPNALNLVHNQKNEIALSLSIFGPGGKPEHRLARKIIKNHSYKNWRLNGEFISGPPDDQARYDLLRPDDLAVMSFEGDPLPTSLNIVILGQGFPIDTALHAALWPRLSNQSMVRLTSTDIAEAITTSGTPLEHPINELIFDPALDAALEDAAFGGERGRKALLRRRSGRSASAADLTFARQNADRVGQAGEGLINALLTQRLRDGVLARVEWSSAQNAVCPYDFLIRDAAGVAVKLDVKSTTGPFERDIHISFGELAEAAEAPERYDLYRVYELEEEGGKLRIAEDIRNFAKAVLTSLDLPQGVRCDSFSVSVRDTELTWGGEVYVPRPDGDDSEEET